MFSRDLACLNFQILKVNIYHAVPSFNNPKGETLGTLCENVKILIINFFFSFLFSHNVIYTFGEKFQFLAYICNYFCLFFKHAFNSNESKISSPTQQLNVSHLDQ